MGFEMVEQPTRTVGQWIEGLAASTSSDEFDDVKMESFFRRGGFPKAVVACGIVYIEGLGSLHFPPMGIHEIAKIVLKIRDS